MAEIKDKIITAESLSALHTHNQNTYMTKTNPIGIGAMTVTGDGSFSGTVEANYIKIGDATIGFENIDGDKRLFITWQ